MVGEFRNVCFGTERKIVKCVGSEEGGNAMFSIGKDKGEVEQEADTSL